MKKIFLFLAGIIFTANFANANYISGGLSYHWLNDLTYEITLTTFTDSSDNNFTQEIDCGDGTFETLSGGGVLLTNGIKKNIYSGTHTYATSGTYNVSFQDTNRIAGIVNVPNSVNVPFCINAILVMNPFLGGNSSPIFNFPFIDNAIDNEIFTYNLGAADSDGDSLVYSLANCKGEYCGDIPGYNLPFAQNSITLNPTTGDFVWDYPTQVGCFNTAILVKEFRSGIFIGQTLQDIEICVSSGSGINDNEIASGFVSVYPNPSNGNNINVNFPFIDKGDYEVMDVLGSVVSQGKISNTDNIEIGFGSIGNGCYFIKILQKEKVYFGKVVKN
ncbi:MAG: T9SS type A sorting domain-containing protein [Bacteroidetes bacterium]|nr:T9SS type A sorting domain-containing protein [Bacteroidota bacterium]